MTPEARHYAAVLAAMREDDGMEKSALFGLVDIKTLGDVLLLGAAVGPGLGLGAAYMNTVLGRPGAHDWARLRQKELTSVYERLAAQAEQRARQMKGLQD